MKDDIKDLLKQRGLKVTNQRVLVLGALCKNRDKHMTAEEIYDLVKPDYPEIGLATVYRTIQLLSELNLVDRVNLDDGYTRYELATQNGSETRHHHHHLICLSCGGVFSFQDDLLENLEDKIEDTEEFQVVDHEVKLYGYCKNCREKKKLL